MFTSITNIASLVMIREDFYVHHFGNKELDRELCDISGVFSFMAGGLYGGIGVAINLGFKKAVLIGCDYAFTPKQDGHFYGADPPTRIAQHGNIYAKLFKEAEEKIELSLVTDTGGSEWLPSEEYEAYTGRKIQYRENHEIVAGDYLKAFDRACRQGMYQSPIFHA